jgi:hypothetical protein
MGKLGGEIMAIELKVSRILEMQVVEEAGVKVIELQSQYARYRIHLDDPARNKMLVDMIVGDIVWPEEPKKVDGPVKMPKLYNRK